MADKNRATIGTDVHTRLECGRSIFSGLQMRIEVVEEREILKQRTHG